MSSEYRLPDGRYTTNVDEFSDAWKTKYAPFETMGLTCIGFDPGLHLARIEDGHIRGSFVLPMWAANILLEKMQAKV